MQSREALIPYFFSSAHPFARALNAPLYLSFDICNDGLIFRPLILVDRKFHLARLCTLCHDLF